MTPSLPQQPDLRHLRNQAKAILKSHQAGDTSVCDMLRGVPRLANMSDPDILAAEVSLQEAQHALAKDYGFATWKALKAHVEADGTVASDDASFLAAYAEGFGAFVGVSEDQRRAVRDRALDVAEQTAGTATSAQALFAAANAIVGACDGARLLSEDGWDRSIELCQRVLDEHPGTPLADQARWYLAMAQGCWAPNHCCHFNQGKQDWPRAIEMYEDIYNTFDEPASRRDALARIAEIQLVRTRQWRDGLATWRRMAEEFPQPTGRSIHETERGCGRAMSEDYFLITFGFWPAMKGVALPDEAVEVRDEFVRLGPQTESIRIGTLVLLVAILRKLGDAERAEDIFAQLGFCESWLVVGPFSGNDALAGDDLKTADLPAELQPMAKSMKSWWDDAAPESMVKEMLTVYPPEHDFLTGQLDLQNVYPVSPVWEDASASGHRREGPLLPERREGKAAWVASSALTPTQVWDATGTVYGLVTVNSPAAQAAQLRTGLSGRLKAWLNRQRVLASDELHDYASLDSFIVPIELKAGPNELFVKFTPYGTDEPVPIRITNEDGTAPEGVSFSAPAEPQGNRAQSEFLKAERSDRPASARLSSLHQ